MVVAKAGVVLPRREGVEDANKDDDELLKRDVTGLAEDVPDREDVGSEAVGVVNREDNMEADGAAGVLKSENPLPDDAAVVAADVCGAVDVP